MPVRFHEFTERFVDLRARYINKLDAEATGRALAKRTFDTSWMGELRKPSSLDPKGWVALRPVSGAAATVFFLRQVLGLASAWEAEPLALLSSVEQGALLLHASVRTTMAARVLSTDLANRVVSESAPELKVPVGTEQIAGLVLELTKRIPGLEVAMAQAVDEAIGRFPTVLDLLGAERVSTMGGCNLADTMMDEVFRLVRELTGYGEGTEGGAGGVCSGNFVLDPMAGFGGIKTVKEVNLQMPSITGDNEQFVTIRSGGDEVGPRGSARFPGGYPVIASPRTGAMTMHKDGTQPTPPSKFRSGSQSARTPGVSVPSQLASPRHRNKLTTLGGVCPKWYPQDGLGARRPTDEFLSPVRRTRHQYTGPGAEALARSARRPRNIGNSPDIHPTARFQEAPPSYTTSVVGPRLQEESARVQEVRQMVALFLRGNLPLQSTSNHPFCL